MNRKGVTLVELLIVVIILCIFAIPVTFLASGGCGDSREICISEGCHTFKEVGLLSGDKNPEVEYQINTGNVVFAVIFCETIVIPVVVLGWWLWEPVGRLDQMKVKGT